MATQLHRLQISLPHWQAQFLAERARRDKISLAEVIRRMIQREAEERPVVGDTNSLMALAGLGEDRNPLIDGTPVSERPEMYLAKLASPLRRFRSKSVSKKYSKAGK